MRENKNNPGGSQSGQDRSNQNLSEKQRGSQNVGRDLDNQNQNQNENLGQGQEQFRGTGGMQGGQGGAHGRNQPGVRNPGQQNIDEPVMSDEDEIGGVGRPEHSRNNPSQQQPRRNAADTTEE